MRKFGKYAIAFFVTFLVFILSGFFSLGSFRSTGASMNYFANETVIFSLPGASKVDSIYVNIGSIYAANGETVQIEVETSTYTTPSSSGTDFGAKFYVSNVYSNGGRNGVQYNWTAVATGQAKANVKHVYFKATKNLQLNEIVCLDENGEVVDLTVYGGDQDNSLSLVEMDKAVDAQGSFKKGTSAYRVLTQEESVYMMSVQTLLLGNSYHEGNVYNGVGDFNFLATIFMLPAVAIFGTSAFAIRIVPFIATCLCMLFVYLLGKELFKSEKYAYFASLIFAIGGMATTLGRMGTPQFMVVSALLGSLYFSYKFFANGISTAYPVKSGLNVLWSGLFSAAAIAMETLAIVPVLGILVVFGFGVRRIFLAEKFATEKLAATPMTLPETGETVDHAKVLKTEFSYKKRVSILFAALSFIVGTFVLWLVGGILFYNAAVKIYDNPSNPSLSFISLVWQGISGSCRVSTFTQFTEGNLSNVFAWFLPILPATVMAGGETGTYLAWNVSLNAAASILSFAAFVLAAVEVVKGFVAKKTDKRTARIRRIFFVLLGGVVLSLIEGVLKGGVSALGAGLFSVFYLSFIPLAAFVLTPEDGENGKSFGDVLLFVSVAAIGLIFVLSIPSAYGFAVPTLFAQIAFGWTSVLSNGYFR